MAETLESIREKQVEELKRQYVEQQEAEEAAASAEQQMERVLRQILEPEAKQRLSNLRIGNKELYLAAVQTIILLFKNQQLNAKLSDAELKALLIKLSEKRNTTIRRK